MTRPVRAWLMVLAAAAGAALHAPAALAQGVDATEDGTEDAEENGAENRWSDGPEAEPDDDGARAVYPPREGQAEPFELETPAAAPLPAMPPVPVTFAPTAPAARMVTAREGADLLHDGALNLADALVDVPGLWTGWLQPDSPLPWMRGYGSDALEVRIDGVPVSPHETMPDFPVLAHIPIDDVARLALRHGPQVGLGLGYAAAGVLDIETREGPRALGEGGQLFGRLRTGMGGADQEKRLHLNTGLGLGRVRLTVTAGAGHRDKIRPGRGELTLGATDGLMGHLGARADVLVHRGLWVFSSWRGSRQWLLPLTERCRLDDAGRRADCALVVERGRDALVTGADIHEAAGGFVLDARVRAHAQRFAEELELGGNQRLRYERAVDATWRTGALLDASLRIPSAPVYGGVAVDGWLEGGLELLRDRYDGVYETRSQRFTDAVPRGDVLSDPDATSLVSPAASNLARAYGRAVARLSRLVLEAGMTVTSERRVLNDDPSRALELPAHDSLGFSGVMAARYRLTDGISAFVSASQLEAAPTLFTLGHRSTRLDDGVEPVDGDAPVRVDRGLEAGGAIRTRWLEIEGVSYASHRTGLLAPAPDDTGVLRLAPLPERWARGVEVRGRISPAFDGLSARGTLGLVVLDEGALIEDGTLNRLAPVGGVLRPAGMGRVDYAPSTWPVSLFVRGRYALPQAQLSPAERADIASCEPVLIDTATQSCRAVLGYFLLDAGARLALGEQLVLAGVVQNLFDNPWAVRSQPLPGGGVAGRVTLTIGW